MPQPISPQRNPFLPSPLAGFLSYVVPGLGQIYQGRIGKGLLFLVCLYGMFFYGMSLGKWKNVYWPDVPTRNQSNPYGVPHPLVTLYTRLQFVGQFWIGAAAWPAVVQYLTYDEKADEHPYLGTFERTPDEEELNRLQRDGDKSWDLGWIYTVIAGVLNILVIYDAFAGPAFAESEAQQRARSEETAPA